MKNQILKLQEKNLKVFGYSDDMVMLSSKGHKTFDSLLASAEKSGMLETIHTIPMSSISEIFFNEKEKAFTIRYDKAGKSKKSSVLLRDDSMREAVVEELGSLRGFSKSVVAESKKSPLIWNSIATLVIPFFTYIFRGMALDAQNGEHYVATGRRRGSAQLLANAVEAIGPTGVTLIGVVGFAIMAYVTYNRYQNPASETKYM